MPIILVSLIFLLGPQVFGAEVAKPVSVSYEQLTRCFPELKDEKISFKVDLNGLKDLSDEKFITSESQLRQRKISYRDAQGEGMALILRTKFRGLKKMETELILQKVDDKGIVTPIALTNNQKINPKQEVINNFLLNAVVLKDEYTYNDTKLNGITSTYIRNFREVVEFSLSDKSNKRSIMCEKQSDLGIICTCTQK